jgi:hypothetical protein
VLVCVCAPVNSDRLPGSWGGTSQPWARRARIGRAAGRRGDRGLVLEPDVDEQVFADHVFAGVEDLALQRQPGGVVQPEPRGQAAVVAPGRHDLRRPVARRARSLVPHDVVRFQQADELGGDAQHAFGPLTVGVGGQVGLAAGVQPRGQRPGDRLAAADMPDVRHELGVAGRAPVRDDLLALVGVHHRRLGRLRQQAGGQDAARPTDRRLGRGRGGGAAGRRVLGRGRLTAAGSRQQARYRHREHCGQQECWPGGTTLPDPAARGGLRGAAAANGAIEREHTDLTVASRQSRPVRPDPTDR